MNFLGIDVGTGGTRAILVDTRGSIVSSATVEHQPFASPRVGWAEQDARDWWRATQEAVRALLSQDGARAEEIGAVGLSGQMHGAVLLDKRDEVLRPAIIWCDQRTEEQCRALTWQIGAARIIELTCNPALTGFTLPKMMWVREHEPDVWRRVRSVLLPKDYVRLQLTDEKATDVADASGTLLLDVARRDWSGEMLAAALIDERLLPSVYESPEITGSITAVAAAATGLRVGTPVVAGAGDQAAGAVGMGIVRTGAVSATIGTSGVVFAVTDRPALDACGRVHTFCHAIEIFREMRVPIEVVRLGGGAARSALWRQIQADAYGRAVETVLAEEGAAYGAALLAGVGSGAWPTVDAACEAVVRVSDRHSPEPSAVKTLDQQYEAFRALYPALRNITERLPG
jgi:xylulokinase